MWCRLFLLVVSVGVLPAVASAQPKAAPVKHDSRALHGSLRDLINAGADLFNENGDHAGCYRVYQGGLVSVKPFLPKEYQAKVDQAFVKAAAMQRFSDKAFELRKTIDDIRTWTGSQRSLWDRLGGDEVVAKIVDDFINAAVKDPKIDFSRGGKHKVDPAVAKQQLIDFISSISGGPYKYTGKNMKDAHKGMGITNLQYDATVIQVIVALEKNKVGEAELNAMIEAVESMRKDIVEAKGTPPTPEPKKEAPKTKEETKSPPVKKEVETKKEVEKKKEEVKKGEPKAAPSQLSGKVTFNGMPAPPGFVTLVSKEGRRLSTSILPDGTYQFKKPLDPGVYQVAIERTPGAVIPANRDIPARYRTETTSGLTVNVTAEKQSFEFNLVR